MTIPISASWSTRPAQAGIVGWSPPGPITADGRLQEHEGLGGHGLAPLRGVVLVVEADGHDLRGRRPAAAGATSPSATRARRVARRRANGSPVQEAQPARAVLASPSAAPPSCSNAVVASWQVPLRGRRGRALVARLVDRGDGVEVRARRGRASRRGSAVSPAGTSASRAGVAASGARGRRGSPRGPARRTGSRRPRPRRRRPARPRPAGAAGGAMSLTSTQASLEGALSTSGSVDSDRSAPT